MTQGKVYLIGAGPGDPGLITVKAAECIKGADVVVYDYLANKKFLEYAREKAEIIYVGKIGGAHTLPQDKINELIIEKAKKGKIIARLKGGDPFIFGRGGEEAEEIVAAGIDFEVIPGVTAGVAAAAYAGIPLTHRDFTTTVAFITGHEDPTKDESNIYWDKISTGIGTLVFYMGIGNLEPNMKKLMENGRSPDTPVALIRWGTTSQQETLVGTIADIAEKAKKANFKAPAITVVGGVVSLRNKLRWFDERPLFGKRVIVTRSREQASDFSVLLEKNGAEPIEFPTIETVRPKDWKEIDRAIKNLPKYDWAIFTSVNGVKYFVERLKKFDKDIRELKGIKICAIGPATAKAIEDLGIKVDLVPKEYRAESIIAGLGKNKIKGKRFLLPRALKAREVLPEEIKRLGGKVDVVSAYRTIKPKEKTDEIRKMLEEKKIDVVTFTSSSTVENFVSMFKKGEAAGLLQDVAVASIGPITRDTASTLGIKTNIMPEKYTIPALTEAIVQYFKK
ncbi:MAG: uroporphyrinogen-III C-methyltransferase [Deltaproteobacteria bacterium GWC2_42_51]|nr:MAG: uroporphyrinogen-III C-methyltransferase [Deltaproteobacteria bacterium GWC2_42_51]OGP38373.1 MAG: uroporphyrinogen-III C-methyltransferase [Deltaproteobacteria bacterium GWD2_42_10]OGP45808.1 MAG: uroporphyrinogen-III C-methyltransferase [Deltaproteobacteria bacterium GWF2_42_12]OGQ37803.1 MAG: uroporphyrinogen-III C-methyltransferase [Deltaproteobacteria bacterium RIFCSPLOWO2_02_FULL_42_39]OGQ68463.1 MAG: uroporphyrinogen-III C-methyltransferase [Deltaproteobacteria bacterium RIFCSPLO